MTPYSLTVPHPTLKALLTHAATDKDVRYYIRGIAIDLTDPADPVLVATDGARILTVRVIAHYGAAKASITQSGDTPERCCAIIPADVIKAWRPGKLGRTALPVTITLGGWASHARGFSGVTLSDATHSTAASTIDGQYPEWRRVMPTTSGQPEAPDARRYSMRYLADIVNALVMLDVEAAKPGQLPPTAGVWPGAGYGPAGRAPLTIPETNGVRFAIMPLRTASPT